MMRWYLYLLNAHQARHIFDLGLGECLTPHGRPWLRWSELGPCNSMQMEEREMGTRTLLRDLNWIELNWIIQCIYVVCSVVCEIHWTVAVCSLLQSIDRIIICPMPDPRKKKKETGKTRERSATTHDFTLFSWCLVRLGAEETADAGAALSVGINMKLYKNIIHTRL